MRIRENMHASGGENAGSRPASPYEIVGVAPDSSHDEIRRAYRRRARELHPDLNPSDPQAAARFRALTDALAVLADAEQRAALDTQLGAHGDVRTPSFPQRAWPGRASGGPAPPARPAATARPAPPGARRLRRIPR